MKRTQVYFMLAVWGTLGMGFLITHYRTPEPEARVYATGDIEVDLPPLVAPRGETELRGRIVLPDGTPVHDCEVCIFREEVSPESADSLYWTFTDFEGRFAFVDLEQGPFRVALLTPKTPPTTLTIELPIEGEVEWTLNPEIPPLEVLPELARTSFAGRIELPEGLNPSDHPLGGYEVCLSPTEATENLSGAVQRRVKTDPLGNFHFPLVAHAEYRLEVLPPWARGGTWPILASRELSAGQDKSLASALEVPLEMGALRGRVTSTEDFAIEGALVKVSPKGPFEGERESRRHWPPTSSDARGFFVVGDLPPGVYRIRVRAGPSAYETEAEVVAGSVTEVTVEPLETRGGK